MTLITLIHSQNWLEVLNRISSHPEEVRPSNYDYLPIHRACIRQNVPVKVIEALIEAHPQSVKQQTKSYEDRLPLHISVCHVSSTMPDVVKVLLDSYKEGALVKDRYGRTPLNQHLMFCQYPSLEMVRMLVEADPDVVRITDNVDWYPLHSAAYIGDWEISQCLIDLYPDALLKKSQHCKTPGDISNNNGHCQLYDKLNGEEEKRFGCKSNP